MSLAEAAIVKNGCTDLSPLKLKPKLSFENHSYEFVIKHRLHCRAVAVVPLKEISGFAWMVVFHLEHWCPECPTKYRPRALLLNQDGSKMRLVRRMSKVPKAWKSG